MEIDEDYSDHILGEVHPLLAKALIHEWAWLNSNRPDALLNLKVQTPKTYMNDSYAQAHARIMLITHPEMKKPWSRVNNFIYKEPYCEGNPLGKSHDYLNNIISALNGPTYWQKLPPTQRKNEYEDLAESLKKVAATLNKVGYHEPALGMMDEETYSDLQFNFFGQWRELTRNDSSFFYKIPELLNRYADTLQLEQRHKRALIDRPNGDDALVTYFSRSLYSSHKHFFGTPLYGVISTIAGIFYPDHDTSSEKIRSSIRAMR